MAFEEETAMYRSPFILTLVTTLSFALAADERPEDTADPSSIIRGLIDAAGKGDALGTSAGRSAEVERWVKVNGESIDAVTASPFKKLPYGTCTQKPGKLYLHVFDWPRNGVLIVPVLNKPKKAYLLADKSAMLETSADKVGLVQVKVPREAPDKIASVVVLEIDGEPEVVGGGRTIRPAADGTLTLLAIDAEVIAKRAKLERKGENPHNIGYWTDVNDFVRWDVALDKPGRYEVELEYSAAPNSGGSEFAVDVLGQAIKGKVEPTASFVDFKRITLGTIEVEKAGAGIVVVRPLTKPGVAVMDLRKIVLRPG
jgi:alpha-L-fucosidase